MNTSSLIKLGSSLSSFALCTALSLSAGAQESAPVAAPAPAPAAAAHERAAEPDVIRPSARPAGRGVAFGMDHGLFGGAYAQGVRIRVPLAEHFAVNLRGLSAIGDRAGDLTWHVGGRVEIIGHTPIYLNLVRMYGGGGPEVTTRIQGTGGGDKNMIGGGGQLGFEFFVNPKFSFFAEVGGRAGDEVAGGGTVLAGMMLYPFTGP